MSDVGTTVVVVEPPNEIGETATEATEEAAEVVEPVAEAAVEIAQIEADRDIEVAQIAADVQGDVIEAAHDDELARLRTENEQCRTTIMALETENTELKAQLALSTPEPSETPESQPEAVVSVEVTPESPEVPEEPEPEKPRAKPRLRWI